MVPAAPASGLACSRRASRRSMASSRLALHLEKVEAGHAGDVPSAPPVHRVEVTSQRLEGGGVACALGRSNVGLEVGALVLEGWRGDRPRADADTARVASGAVVEDAWRHSGRGTVTVLEVGSPPACPEAGRATSARTPSKSEPSQSRHRGRHL